MILFRQTQHIMTYQIEMSNEQCLLAVVCGEVKFVVAVVCGEVKVVVALVCEEFKVVLAGTD